MLAATFRLTARRVRKTLISGSPPVFQVAFVVEQDESPGPIEIVMFLPDSVVPNTDRASYLDQKRRLIFFTFFPNRRNREE